MKPDTDYSTIIIPVAWIGSESIAYEAEIQLVGQKNIETKHLSVGKARLQSFSSAKTQQIHMAALFATSVL